MATKKILQIRVDGELLDGIKAIGQAKYPELGVSQNKLIEMALKEYVEKYAPKTLSHTEE